MSCVLNVASVSGLSILIVPSVSSNLYLLEKVMGHIYILISFRLVHMIFTRVAYLSLFFVIHIMFWVTLKINLSSPLVFRGVRVIWSLVLCVLFCRSLFVLLSFFFWPLCCLSFFDLRILINYHFGIFELFLNMTETYEVVGLADNTFAHLSSHCRWNTYNKYHILI